MCSHLGAASNLNGLHHLMEAPAMVRKIVWAAENGYARSSPATPSRPGVDGGRLAVGFGDRAAAHIAARGPRIDRPRWRHRAAGFACAYTRRILHTYGLESFVTGISPSVSTVRM
jgi:hypothetical protein